MHLSSPRAKPSEVGGSTSTPQVGQALASSSSSIPPAMVSSPLPETTNHPTSVINEPIVPEIPVVIKATSLRASHAPTQAS
ncbi:hypothetical protein ACFX19_020593 [Malus domestica]